MYVVKIKTKLKKGEKVTEQKYLGKVTPKVREQWARIFQYAKNSTYVILEMEGQKNG